MGFERGRVVVVGGRGYVGGRVAEHLRAQSCDVRVTGRTPRPGPRHAAEVLDLMTDADSRVDEVLAGAGAVVNCVAHNENQAAADPEGAAKVAVAAAGRLGEAVVRLKVPRLLHLSTVHVYGTFEGDMDEDTEVRPTHPYAVAHAAAERAVCAATGSSGQGVIVRLSNAVGPPVRPDVDRWTLVTNDLARTWAETGALRLRSDGTARRDFVALADVCRAVHHLLSGPTFLPRLLHVCSGVSRSVGEVAERMSRLTETISGVRAPVRRPPGASASPAPPYHLSNARLLATGFRFLDCLDDELESLLVFAQKHFRPRS
ncbi:MAG: NAD-dependent epimerase/dehydratase family protein [Acidimicrobiales bacterium]